MGLFNWAHNTRMTDPVDGTLQLTSCSSGASDAMYSNCRMTGVVSAPGLAPTAVEHKCTAPTKKWPQPGQTLPVQVDRADPSRLQIRWDDLPSNRELGRQFARRQAEWLAADQRSQAGPAEPGEEQTRTWSSPPGGPQVNVRVRSDSGPVQPHVEVFGDPDRILPGRAGGGLTPGQAAAARYARRRPGRRGRPHPRRSPGRRRWLQHHPANLVQHPGQAGPGRHCRRHPAGARQPSRPGPDRHRHRPPGLMFGRKKKPGPAAAPTATLVSGPYDGTALRNQVPARLRVGAVTPPSQPRTGDAALVSGLLLGPFQVMLVQATAALPQADWPQPGTELPAAADPSDPMRFAVV